MFAKWPVLQTACRVYEQIITGFMRGGFYPFEHWLEERAADFRQEQADGVGLLAGKHAGSMPRNEVQLIHGNTNPFRFFVLNGCTAVNNATHGGNRDASTLSNIGDSGKAILEIHNG